MGETVAPPSTVLNTGMDDVGRGIEDVYGYGGGEHRRGKVSPVDKVLISPSRRRGNHHNPHPAAVRLKSCNKLEI